MGYLIGALAVALALSGAYGWYQGQQRQLAEAKVGELTTKIEQQNQAVLATKAEGDRRVAQALKGVQEASRATQGAQAEAVRLRGLAGEARPTPAGACPERDAVAEIRRGLK